MANVKKKNTTKKITSKKKAAKPKVRELVTLSEIARRNGVSRQSARNWAVTHVDTFPAPLIGNDGQVAFEIDGDVVEFTVRDPHGKIALYDAVEIETWLASGALRIGHQRRGSAAPTSKAAKKTTPKKAAPKKTSGKKKVTKKEEAPKKVAADKKATKKKSTTKKTTAKKKTGGTTSKMAREAARSKKG